MAERVDKDKGSITTHSCLALSTSTEAECRSQAHRRTWSNSLTLPVGRYLQLRIDKTSLGWTHVSLVTFI